jgi:electron transfer flavoprotein beta subunit
MHIAVCVNRIPDPEAPWKEVKLNESLTAPLLEKLDLVIGPFDENAMEIALQLKDSVGARVTVLTLGPASSEDALRRSLAVRCDAAVHVLEGRAAGLDSSAVARVLGGAIRRIGGADLVLCGRQVGDWDSGQVGLLLAEELGVACIPIVRRVDSGPGQSLRMVKEISGGTCLVEALPPLVATITNTGANQLRVARVKDVMAARRAEITVLTLEDLGFEAAALLANPTVSVRKAHIPESRGRVRMIDASNPEEAADRLARHLVSLTAQGGHANSSTDHLG